MSHKPLSKSAAALLKRVSDPGRWYRWEPKPSKPMQELIDAGLVVRGGRVVKIAAFFVPKGVRPFELERYPDDAP